MSLTICPSDRNRIRSAIAAARGSWVTITTVWPTESTERRSSCRISSLAVESRFPVGSSANSTVGRLSMARAIATRCCWPPESSAGRCVRRSRKPVSSITVSSHSRSGSRPAMASGSSMFSRASSIGSRLKNWNTNPMWSRRSRVRASSLSWVMSVPLSFTEPSVGRSRPARICISVDLPEPDGPMTAVSLPRSISAETSRSAMTAVSPSPKRRVTSDAVTTAAVSSLCSCASCTRPTLARHATIGVLTKV